MREQRVDATIARETHQMQAMRPGVTHGVQQNRILEELAVSNHQIDARDVHVNHAPGANVQMSNLAVAHLPLREPDIGTGGVHQRIRIIAQQRIVSGFARGGDRVAFRGG